MATTVMGALIDLFQGDGALPLLCPGGVWQGQAPENNPLPFVVLEHGGETTDPNSESVIENTTVVFHCFAKGAAATEAIVAAIRQAFDFARMVISGVFDMGIMPLSYRLTPDERADDTEIVYHAAVSYLARVNRVRIR